MRINTVHRSTGFTNQNIHPAHGKAVDYGCLFSGVPRYEVCMRADAENTREGCMYYDNVLQREPGVPLRQAFHGRVQFAGNYSVAFVVKGLKRGQA